MNPRRIRAALLAAAAVLVIAVAVSLRGPKRSPSPPPTLSKQARTETRTKGLVYRTFKEGVERMLIEADSLAAPEGEAMRLKGVKATSIYMAQGEPGKLTIASEECLWNEAQQRAVFKRDVRVTTQDGFELTTDSLLYRGDRELAKTEDAASFKRKEVSGTSTGVEYDATNGRILLPKDVAVRIESESGPPTNIKSKRAVALRERGTLQFTHDVLAVQGDDTLKSNNLVLSFDRDRQLLERAVATGEVELQTHGASSLPGIGTGKARGKSSKRLTAHRLEIAFRADRSMREATAVGDALLVVTPGPGEKRERKRLAGRILFFGFDDESRVERVRGQKKTSLTIEPLDKGGVPRKVEADRFLAHLNPATGEADNVEFFKHVLFTRGADKGSAERARYVGRDHSLRLDRSPRMLQDGNELTAKLINLTTDTGDVQALRDVRHVLKQRPGEQRGGLFSEPDVPTVITCQKFNYVSKSRTANYEGGSVLRSRQDEVRAERLTIEEDAKGARRLKAEPEVASLLHPRAATAGEQAPAPLDVRSKSMLWEETARRVVYSGDVSIKQGDILTKSPKATLILSEDGAGMEKLLAGEPVEVRQGAKIATGRQGVYTPGNETMVLTGEKVTLRDPTRQTGGKSLTFHVGDDRIVVEGREDGRTETVLKKEPPPP